MTLDESLDVNLQLVKFTAQDRCERCGAQAYAMAQRDDVSSELLFCLHHMKQHEPKLLDEGWAVVLDYEAADQLHNPKMQAPV